MRPVRCPTCQKAGDWFAGRHGPFCSQRCKLIDLGKWFNGENGISTPLKPDQMEDMGSLPADETLDKFRADS